MNATQGMNTHGTGRPAHAERRFLVAVSEHKEHLQGIRFMSGFFQSRTGVLVELVFLLPPRTGTLRGPYGTIMGLGSMDESIFAMHVERGRRAVEEATRLLIQEGFGADAVRVELTSPKDALNRDMLERVLQGQFDAIVMGNRGRGWLERALEGEVDIGEELMRGSCRVPLWICATPRPGAGNVLLCLDGSEMAYAMARHVGAMLRAEVWHTVTLLRVKRDTPASPYSPEEILEQGREILRQAGIADQRIEAKIVVHNDVVQAIMHKAEVGNYAVVATGRQGAGAGMIRRVFMGSVTEKLFRTMQQGSLWVLC